MIIIIIDTFLTRIIFNEFAWGFVQLYLVSEAAVCVCYIQMFSEKLKIICENLWANSQELLAKIIMENKKITKIFIKIAFEKIGKI